MNSKKTEPSWDTMTMISMTRDKTVVEVSITRIMLSMTMDKIVVGVIIIYSDFSHK